MSDKNVTAPCSQIVNCCDQSLLGGGWLVKSLDEARININWGEDSNIVTNGWISR
jgi:hypothetical protein